MPGPAGMSAWRAFGVRAFAFEDRVLRRSAGAMSSLGLRRSSAQAGILAYHRIAEMPDSGPRPTWNVTPDALQRQLEGLLDRGFRAVRLRELLDRPAEADTAAHRCFATTFDDGYENFLTGARPILRALNIPSTIFLSTAYVGQEAPFPFDDWESAGSADVPSHTWRPLSLQQCRELTQDPLVEIGAHSHSHRDLRGDPVAFAQDLARCLDYLREHFSIVDPPFAFPFGYAVEATREAARRAGVSCALTTRPAQVQFGSDPFSWGRILASQQDTAATLAGCLDGSYATLRRYRPGRRR